MTLTERVARAILAEIRRQADEDHSFYADSGSDLTGLWIDGRVDLTKVATAAMEAMREDVAAD